MTIPYAIEVVHIPTDPPITWPIVVVAAECEDPSKLTRMLRLPGIPLALDVDRGPADLEPMLNAMEMQMIALAKQMGVNLTKFIQPTEKLAMDTRDKQVAQILEMIRPSTPGGKIVVQRPN